MKTLKLTLAFVVVSIMLVSCNDGKKELAQEKVESYEAYIDSITQVATVEVMANWDAIENDCKNRQAEADNALIAVKENSEMKKSMEESTLKFETFKSEVMAEHERMEIANSKMMMRQSLLGSGYAGGDMKFEWINKDNILSVYQNFVDTVIENKDSYSREDWDEIKLLYEAIDTRKNTVENEGLSSADNRKIAGLKLKFAPMYTLNRMGAKSEENAAAKQ